MSAINPEYELDLVPFLSGEIRDVEPPPEVWGRGWTCLTGTVGRMRDAVDDWRNRSRVFNFYQLHSDLIQSVVILAFSITFLAGEIFHDIPDDVTNGAYTALSFVGLLSLNFMIGLLSKDMGDTRLAYRTRNWKIFTSALAKTTYVASSIALTCSTMGAAIARADHHQEITNEIYKLTRPVGEVGIALSLGVNLYQYWTNRPIIAYLKEGLAQEELERIRDVLLEELPPTALDTRASDIRARMDKDTYRSLLKDLHRLEEHPERLQALFRDSALANIETQQIMAKTNIGLQLAGDIGMAISDWYPGTVIQAGIGTFFSVLYTGSLIYEKIRQAQQREAGHAVAESSTEEQP